MIDHSLISRTECQYNTALLLKYSFKEHKQKHTWVAVVHCVQCLAVFSVFHHGVMQVVLCTVFSNINPVNVPICLKNTERCKKIRTGRVTLITRRLH